MPQVSENHFRTMKYPIGSPTDILYQVIPGKKLDFIEKYYQTSCSRPSFKLWS